MVQFAARGKHSKLILRSVSLAKGQSVFSYTTLVYLEINYTESQT